MSKFILEVLPNGGITITPFTPPTLEEVLNSGFEAKTNTAVVRQLGLVNLDEETKTVGISANNSSVTFACSNTGKELTIDFSSGAGNQPIFSIVGG